MSYSFSIFLKDFVSQNAFKMQLAVDRVSQSVINTTSKLQKYSSFTGKSLDQLNEKLQLQKAARGANSSVSGIMRLNTAIRQTEREIRRLENLPPMSFLDRIRKGTRELGGMVGVAGGLALATAAFSGIKGIAELGMDAEDTQIKFEVMLGSAEKAKGMLTDITTYANKTPFGSSELKQSAELLLNFGLSAEKIMPTMKMLGDVSGGNKDRLQGLTLAYSQMASTGRLMGQDLNQMINAGFNPLQVISQKTGVSIGKLKEQMEAGKISVGMVEEAFKLATGPGGRFNGMMGKVAESARGKFSAAMDSIQTRLTSFGQKYITPIVGTLAEMAETFFSSLDEMGRILKPFFDTLRPLWEAIAGFASSFFGLSEATGGTASVINFLKNTLSYLEPVLSIIVNGVKSFIQILTPLAPLLKWVAILWGGLNMIIAACNFIMNMNPIGGLVAAFIILMGVIVTCWQRFATFRAVILGAWEAVKGFGELIKNYVINRLKELLSGIAGIGKALIHFFSGDFAKAWDAGQKAAGDLMGVGSASKLINDGRKVAGKVGAAYNAEFVKKQDRPKVFDVSGKSDAKAEKDKKSKSSPLDSKKASESIIGGGSKTTHITINLAKMQDQIVINTVSAGEGATKIRQMLEEELNRLLGSVASMQSA